MTLSKTVNYLKYTLTKSYADLYFVKLSQNNIY